ncbi:MAG: hypothetical protein WKF97_00710 [Chitinophagaceae bacterium]
MPNPGCQRIIIGKNWIALATNEVLHNDWRRAISLNDDLRKLKASDVNNVFRKYFTNLTWVYQGDPGKVDAALYTKTTLVNPKRPQSKLDQKKKN